MTGLLLSPESTNESIPNYRHNFVGGINKKSTPNILSPKSYTGIKFDIDHIKEIRTTEKNPINMSIRFTRDKVASKL